VKFSVVIPTCHRPEALARCLECLADGRQRGFRLGDVHEAGYEVIVSDAGTRATVAGLLAERFPWARWVAAAGCGPGPNRNLGARSARGDWLAFVDDDCLPAADWLERLAARTVAGIDVVEGAILSPSLPDHPLWTAPVNTSGNAGWTANLCVRRAAFERLGGFDRDLPETAEDMEFHVRSTRAGSRWVFAADATVEHPPRRMTWAQFWRETLRFRWWFMFRLKTGAGPGPEAGPLRTAWDVGSSLVLLYARMSWHFVRDLARGQHRTWRRDLFLRVRDWLLLPVLAPYFWLWARRYRAALRQRQSA